MEMKKRLIEYGAVYNYAFDGVHGGGLEDEDFSAIITAIDSVPAVDAVEVVHGRWIEKIDVVSSYLAGCEELFYECSVCNAPNFGESPYCPNCGAKMDGGNEDG